jgi:hypothetical protein
MPIIIIEKNFEEILSQKGGITQIIKDIHLKLGILVHYQKRNHLQQGR